MKAKEQDKKQTPAKYRDTGAGGDQVIQAATSAWDKAGGGSVSDTPTRRQHQEEPVPHIEPIPQADGSSTSKQDSPNEKAE